jgi:hypothetical protein
LAEMKTSDKGGTAEIAVVVFQALEEPKSKRGEYCEERLLVGRVCFTVPANPAGVCHEAKGGNR